MTEAGRGGMLPLLCLSCWPRAPSPEEARQLNEAPKELIWGLGEAISILQNTIRQEINKSLCLFHSQLQNKRISSGFAEPRAPGWGPVPWAPPATIVVRSRNFSGFWFLRWNDIVHCKGPIR